MFLVGRQKKLLGKLCKATNGILDYNQLNIYMNTIITHTGQNNINPFSSKTENK